MGWPYTRRLFDLFKPYRLLLRHEAFEVLLDRLHRGHTEQSLLITGLRGVGKTVLLGAFEERARERHWTTVEAEITKNVEFGVRMAQLARRALLQVAPRARCVVFLFDEVQFLSVVELEALIAALHKTVQRQLPITLVGAGLPQLPRLAGEAKSYAERLFQFPMIGRLSPTEAARALVEPAAPLGVEFDHEAVEAIVDTPRDTHTSFRSTASWCGSTPSRAL